MLKAGSGTALFNIYKNLFQGSVEDIKHFQEVAAQALLDDKRMQAFQDMLATLNDGDPGLTPAQIEALSYLMGASGKASLVKPWDDTPGW